jgi:chemotaxis protein MotA
MLSSKLTFVKVVTIIGGISLLIPYYLDDGSAALNLPGLAFVIVGVLGAGLLGTTWPDFWRFIKVSLRILFGKQLNIKQDVDEIVYVARLWHEKKIKGIEAELENIANPFLRYSIELIIDQTPLNEIHSLLRWRAHRIKTNEQVMVQIAQSLAYYAPAFGMLGTILGLINMLAGLENGDIQLIGANMAIALITTFYGILLANLVFRPIAERLERRIHHQLKLISLIMEGVELIHQNRSPSLVYVTLHSFITDHEDELRDGEYNTDHSAALARYKRFFESEKNDHNNG